MMSPARRVALHVVRAVHAHSTTLGESLARWRPQLPDPRDRALVTEIATGCLRWRAAIDHLITIAADRPVGRLDDVVLDLLRLAVFQLLWLDRVPAAAIVNDSVELTRLVKRRSAAGFVNAVLRRVQRDGRAPLPARPTHLEGGPAVAAAWREYLSVSLSHPAWLVDRWTTRFGVEGTERWLQFNLQPAPLCLSVPDPGVPVNAVIEALTKAGLEARRSTWAHDVVVVARGQLPSNDEVVAQCWLQDEASHLVGLVPAPSPGMRTLDCCAAPGGKTRQLALAQQRLGLLVAGDVRPARMRLLSRTLASGGVLPFAKVVCFDSSRPLPFTSTFDRVLVDAPCSGVGTVRRDPELKWTRHESTLDALARRQVAMLTHTAAHVAIGGVLTYATCSSEPEENEDPVGQFLAATPHFTLERVDVTTRIDPALVDASGALRTMPHRHGLEAFYAVRLRRLR
jgi:16S rRNA (cytosine967-C5)-methyltransferase